MDVSLFPLPNIVFYPSMSRPFHIFEPRYIQMVEDCVRTGQFIAIGHVDSEATEIEPKLGEELKDIYKTAGFGNPLIHERKKDGSLIIFLHGRGKLMLKKVVDRGTPYIVCDAEVVIENHDIDDAHNKNFMILQKYLVKWVRTHIPDPNHQDLFLKNLKTPEEVIGNIVSYSVSDIDIQQSILEMNSINEKITLLFGLFQSGELI